MNSRIASFIELQDKKQRLDQDLDDIFHIIKGLLPSTSRLFEEICRYVGSQEGKMLRPRLLLESVYLGEELAGKRIVERGVCLRRGACVQLIHMASLLHDDVIDKGMKRRGKASVFKAWGASESLLSGDYFFSKAFQLALGDPDPRTALLVGECVENMVLGEFLQLEARGNLKLSVEQCLRIAKLKTGSLFDLCCSLAVLESGENEALLEGLSESFGVLFQLKNDEQDFQGFIEGAFEEEDQGNDIFQRQVTLPILISYKNMTSREKSVWKGFFTKDPGVSSSAVRSLLWSLDRKKATSDIEAVKKPYVEKMRQVLGRVNPPGRPPFFLELLGSWAEAS